MAPAQKAIVELVYDLSNPFSYIALVTLARYAILIGPLSLTVVELRCAYS